ncbi:MAG: M28 family peptidase [Scytonematopsis contorta HA4267-MV1]|jgi:hypothetical protein|nr:M28 family peptidase [Scytonematopsis contorta HA4267-MV1]
MTGIQRRKKWNIKIINRAALVRISILGIIFITIALWFWFALLKMPGASYRGQLPPLTVEESTLKDALQIDIKNLGGDIKQRNSEYYESLQNTSKFLESSFNQASYTVNKQEYRIGEQSFTNLEVEITGVKHPDEIVIVGAHYDSAFSSPGANDNGSGTAAVLELARKFAKNKFNRTLRFVEFVNEEPPFFWTDNMGSLVYAKRCRERKEKIVAMLSLETMGYYSDDKNSQKYPFPLSFLYPSQGQFIGFVGNISSAEFVKKTVASFRNHAKFPSEGAALPEQLPGVGWSDQWSFWQQGYPGVMVTDTALFRYPYYHTLDDTPEKIDYGKLARVVYGLERVIEELVN